jgi:hypothetical protein
MTLQGVHLAKTGCTIPCSSVFSMLRLVKIGRAFGKLGVQNTPWTPGWLTHCSVVNDSHIHVGEI